MRWRCGLILLLALTGCGANVVGNRRATMTACALGLSSASADVAADSAYITTVSMRDGVYTRFSLHAPDGPTTVPVPANRVIIADLVWTLTLTLPPGMPPPDTLLMETHTSSVPRGDTVGSGVYAADMLGPPTKADMTYTWSGQAYVSPLPQGFSSRAGALLWPQFTTLAGAFSAGQLTFALHPDGKSLHASRFRVQVPAECR